MGQEKTTTGYVYILTNKFVPNLVKIGKTTRNGDIRTKEVSSPTGVPGTYETAHKRWVVNCHVAEKEVHWVLRHKRPDKRKEFFELTLDEAIEIVDEICDKHSVNKVVSSHFFNDNNNDNDYDDKSKNNKAEKPNTKGGIGCLVILAYFIFMCATMFSYPNSSIEQPSATQEPPPTATLELLPTPTTEILPTPTVEIAPTPTLYSEAENPPKAGEIVWNYELKELTANKSRWDIWKEVVEAKVQGHMSWNEFNEQVFLHNSNLTEDKSYFRRHEVYVLPQLQ
jgi:hypothetical protein